MAEVDHDEVRSFSQLHQRLRKEATPPSVDDRATSGQQVSQ